MCDTRIDQVHVLLLPLLRDLASSKIEVVFRCVCLQGNFSNVLALSAEFLRVLALLL